MLEYLVYTLKKRNILPIHLILEVTSRCNSRCLTCFNWQKTDLKKKKELSLKQIEKISKTMNNLLWLSLTGGEVFLRDDLTEIIKIFVKNNKPEHITIPTNALLPKKIALMTEDILKNYKGNFVITLSLDGIGSLHDKIRGVKGNFKKFLETYKELDKLRKNYPNLHIGVNTVINNLNQNHIKEIYEYVKKNIKVESHTFELVRGCTRSEKVKAPSIDFYKKKKDFFKKVMKSYSYYTFNPMSMFLKAAKIYYHDLAYEILKSKKQLIPCYAGILSAVIDVKGNVYPCELYKKFGNLKSYNYNFKKLWFQKKADKIREEIANKKCYCAHSCFQFVNILFNPKLYPKLIKYMI